MKINIPVDFHPEASKQTSPKYTNGVKHAIRQYQLDFFLFCAAERNFEAEEKNREDKRKKFFPPKNYRLILSDVNAWAKNIPGPHKINFKIQNHLTRKYCDKNPKGYYIGRMNEPSDGFIAKFKQIWDGAFKNRENYDFLGYGNGHYIVKKNGKDSIRNSSIVNVGVILGKLKYEDTVNVIFIWGCGRIIKMQFDENDMNVKKKSKHDRQRKWHRREIGQI